MLCAEAESYANQDYARQKEVTIGMPVIKINIDSSLLERILSPNGETDGLTPTERRIFTLRKAGLTNKEVLQMLNISYNSLKMHLSNIKKKLR
jgi:DNA-binding NarL/FixJ family response regulator